MRVDMIGFDGESFVIAGNGLIQLSQFSERITKVAVRSGVVGLDGECLGDEINGNVVSSHLMGDHTKQSQSDGLIGLGLQYLFVDAFSLRQATHLVVLHGKV